MMNSDADDAGKASGALYEVQVKIEDVQEMEDADMNENSIDLGIQYLHTVDPLDVVKVEVDDDKIKVENNYLEYNSFNLDSQNLYKNDLRDNVKNEMDEDRIKLEFNTKSREEKKVKTDNNIQLSKSQEEGNESPHGATPVGDGENDEESWLRKRRDVSVDYILGTEASHEPDIQVMPEPPAPIAETSGSSGRQVTSGRQSSEKKSFEELKKDLIKQQLEHNKEKINLELTQSKEKHELEMKFLKEKYELELEILKLKKQDLLK